MLVEYNEYWLQTGSHFSDIHRNDILIPLYND